MNVLGHSIERILFSASLRCALTGGVSISIGAITADNLAPRMLREPIRRCSRRAVLKWIHHAAPLPTDHDRSIIRTRSSMPTTRAAAKTVEGANRFFTVRRIVVSLIGMPRRASSRSENRPPTLWPNSLTIPAKRAVRRENEAASAGTRLAKIRRSH